MTEPKLTEFHCAVCGWLLPEDRTLWHDTDGETFTCGRCCPECNDRTHVEVHPDQQVLICGHSCCDETRPHTHTLNPADCGTCVNGWTAKELHRA